MYALFEESGKFFAGRVLSEAESSAQIELDSGKRAKVKTVDLLLKFDKPVPAEFLVAAQARSQDTMPRKKPCPSQTSSPKNTKASALPRATPPAPTTA